MIAPLTWPQIMVSVLSPHEAQQHDAVQVGAYDEGDVSCTSWGKTTPSDSSPEHCGSKLGTEVPIIWAERWGSTHKNTPDSPSVLKEQCPCNLDDEKWLMTREGQ